MPRENVWFFHRRPQKCRDKFRAPQAPAAAYCLYIYHRHSRSRLLTLRSGGVDLYDKSKMAREPGKKTGNVTSRAEREDAHAIHYGPVVFFRTN